MNIEKMKIDIDSVSLHIFIDNGDDIDPISIVYWHIDEVEEDSNVCISMLNAVQLFYTDKQKLINLIAR